MNTTSGDYLQRVFAWRWTAPDNQTSLLLDVDELERVWTQQQVDFRAELDADTDVAPAAPRQTELYPGLGQRGGRYDRTPPQLSLIADCFPPEPQRTRLELETGFELASPEQLAVRMGQAFLHRGRPKGLSPIDYNAQRELTVARSLTWTFFERCRELPSAPVVWREKFDDAAAVLGFLLWARRLGRAGITLSGPQWAAVLGCGESTVWRWLQRLERAGYIIRCRRYKPGLNGRPVALTANWYAFGPVALRELADIERPEPAVRRARLRVRRRHLRALGRRRGVDLLRGYQWPSRAAFAAETCAAYVAARARDADRYRRFLAGEAPVDFTTASPPAFVFALDADEPLLERFDSGDQVEDAPPEHAGGEDGGEREHGGAGVLQKVTQTVAVLAKELDGVQLLAEVAKNPPEGERRAHGDKRNGGRRRRTEPEGRHGSAVARQRPTDHRDAFFFRCANAQPGSVGAVSGRESRARSSEITISRQDGPPLEKRKGLEDWPPRARDVVPRKSLDEPPNGSATADGPLKGSGCAVDAVLFAVKDPRLRAAALAMARAAGIVVD